MVEGIKSNTLLLVTSSMQHVTRNRNGDVYKFSKDVMEYKGSSKLLSALNFSEQSQVIPKDKIEIKTISDIIEEEQFDELWMYIPFIKDEKLVIPKPWSEKRATMFNYRFTDCTISGSTAFPVIDSTEDKITIVDTIVCDTEKPDATYKISSYWRLVEGNIKPAYISL